MLMNRELFKTRCNNYQTEAVYSLHDPFQLHIGVDRGGYRRADNQQILFKQNGENFVDAGKGGKSSNIVVQDAAKKLCPGAREFSRPPQLA